MGVMPPWSFSSLTKFETCPRQYYHQKVAADVQDVPGEAARWGSWVHTSLENHVRDGAPLPEAVEHLSGIMQRITSKPGDKLVERQMAVTAGFTPATWAGEETWCRGIVDLMLVNGSNAVVLDYKGLSLDTRIPTPFGWTTMGAITVGTIVFDSEGRLCSVVGKSEVKHLPCYKITFDDKTSVVCDDEHLWKLVDGTVVGVQELIGKRHTRQRYRPPRIAVAAPLRLPLAKLPIHPYVLGLWLADGKQSSSEVSKPDDFVWEKVRSCGYAVNMETGGSGACPTRTIQGIRSTLRQLGLHDEKFIPAAYLRASYEQRVELLRGLMDGDGSANPTRKQAVYMTCSKRLSDDVCELLSSLGQRPSQAVTTQRGFGKTVTAYPVSFRPQNQLNPFSLPRKANRINPDWGNGQSDYRIVISVEEVPSVPTQCISVDSKDHTFLCTDRMIPTHNTGKRKPESDQLKLFSGLVFANFPEIDRIRTGFLWIKEGKMDTEVFTRDEIPDIWNTFLPRVRRLEVAYEKDKWPAKTSGLCKRHCSVGRDRCEFCGL